MKVYVAMIGMYEDSWLGGVYATLDAAMADYDAPDGWLRPAGEREWWSNDLDWERHVEISATEVIGADPH